MHGATGYAATVGFSVQQSAFRDQMLAAEEAAKKAKVGLWSVPGALEAAAVETAAEAKDVDETFKATISHVNSLNDFYVHESGSEVSPFKQSVGQPASQAGSQSVSQSVL